VIVLLAHLEPGAVPALPVLVERLDAAADGFPLLRARLQGTWWVPATGPGVAVVGPGEPPLAAAPLQRFDLEREPPLRVLTSTDGD